MGNAQGGVAQFEEMAGDDLRTVTIGIRLDSGPERKFSDMILQKLHIMGQIVQIDERLRRFHAVCFHLSEPPADFSSRNCLRVLGIEIFIPPLNGSTFLWD